ncbi:MAG: hypothetical protein JNK82_45265 [Myxococcaceae bacterium]|nr:hypothetical protein [Myxococcaceae bacterium]
MINVVDDVGVGDHFPSHVPGAAPYKLPPRDDLPPPPPPKEQAPAENPVSDPGEWATIGAPAQPAPQPQPVAQPAPVAQPQAPAAAPTPVATPKPTPAPAPSLSADLERETLERASNSLLQGTCESELPRLAELLERTDSAGIKARVRIIRARCYSTRSKPERAKLEYTAYLRDFPEGVWADEARDAAK